MLFFRRRIMREYSKNINRKISEYKEVSAKIFNKVKAYKKIAIFAHRSPDFDAFGSQFGLATYLKENYASKEIIVLGDNHYLYSGDLYPLIDNVDDSWFDKDTLSIIVDTSTLERTSDPRHKLAREVIKIDHHPNVDPYGDICFVDVTSVAVSEILALLMLTDGGTISKDTASYLFSGIVGDSGRFKYASTTATTFAVTEVLINHGLDIDYVYNKLYAQELADLNIMAYILNNYKVTPNGFAYYIVTEKTQARLNIGPERAKESVNVFSGIRGIKAWAAITEVSANNEWRVSLRSASKPINHLAEKWRGGGHVQASGASLLNEDEIEQFVNEVNEYLKD